MPKILRADRGTENSLISGIQPYLRDGHSDSLAREKSFMHGKSTSNQRIERFWGHVRKNCAQFWMNLFKNMIDRQLFDNSNPIHIDCIRYCFMDLIQQDLNKVVKEWNLHPIRKQKNDGVFGKPEILYTQSDRFGGEECGLPIDMESINTCKEIYCEDIIKESNKDFEDLLQVIMPETAKPSTPQEAEQLFTQIITTIDIHSE